MICLVILPSVFLPGERVFMKNRSAPPIRYDHSMGQMGGRLPAYILRTTRP